MPPREIDSLHCVPLSNRSNNQIGGRNAADELSRYAPLHSMYLTDRFHKLTNKYTKQFPYMLISLIVRKFDTE